MDTNRFALATVVVGCLTAAGVGGYLATFQDTASLAPSVAAAPVGTAVAPAQEAPAAEPVAPKSAPVIPEPTRTKTAPPIVRNEESSRPPAVAPKRAQAPLPDHPQAAPDRSASGELPVAAVSAPSAPS